MNTFAKKNLINFSKIFLTLVIVVSTFLIGATSASAAVAPTANPVWPNKCGIKLSLIIDRSSSIDGTETGQMETAAKGFVTTLAGTQSQISVTSFGIHAQQVLGFTSIAAVAGQNTVKTAIENDPFSGTQYTNWDAAFQSQVGAGADLVVILTDGNPTIHNDGSADGVSSGSVGGTQADLDAGVTSANAVKSGGARIVAVGIGDDLDIANLKLVSGNNVNDDYFTSSFATLNTKLSDIATKLCGGTVTVQKQVKNADGSYTNTNGWTYTATNATTSSQVTAGQGTAEFKYDNISQNGKSTTITEDLASKPGFSIESISCTKNNQSTGTVNGASVSLTVNSNEFITCVFKNTHDTGTLQVKKVATGGNDTFAFTSNSALGNFNLTTVGGNAQTAVTTVATGTYDITESALAGWSLTDITCTGNSSGSLSGPKATVVVGKGQNVVCTYTNARQTATLKVVKYSNGGNGTFGFTSNTALGNFNLTTSSGAANTAVTSIPTGSYNVAESALAGWSLTDASCTGTNASKNGSSLSFTATANANIVCTFTNTRDQGTIKVIKNTVGGDGQFYFNSNTALDDFSLTTSGGTKSSDLVNADTGSYNISEVVPEGWTLSAISCTGGSADRQGDGVSVEVNKGANVVCTFTNTRDTGKLKVIKKTSGGNGTFSFQSNTALGSNFDLTTVGGTAETATENVGTGSYTITEDALAGWTLTDIECNGGQYQKIGNTVVVTVAKDANVTCTFDNTRDTAKLTVVKKVTAAGGVSDGSFSFTSNTALGDFNLTTVDGTASTETVTVPTGSYNINESVPEGWTLTSQDCTGTDANEDGGLYFELGKDDVVVCTFTNERDTATIKVVKSVSAQGGVTDGTFSFTSDSLLGDFSLTTEEGTASTKTVTVPTGIFSVSENIPDGWTLQDINCDGGSINGAESTFTEGKGSVKYMLEKGNNAVCTFTNTRDTGDITVIKNVVAAGGVTDGTFDFESDIDLLGDFSLTTEGGTASTETIAVPTGEYNIDEIVPTGWNLDSVSCVDLNDEQEVRDASVENAPAAASANAVITTSSNVVCTFTNTRDTSTIQVVENAIGGNDTFPFTITEEPAPVEEGSFAGIATLLSPESLGSLSAFSLATVAGTAQTAVTEIPTGVYNIAQAVPAGWTLTSLSCTGVAVSPTVSNPKLVVNAQTDENIVCTFVNTKDPEVLGTVVTRPGDTVVPPTVLGTSASRLPATGFQGKLIALLGTVLVAAGALFFSASRRKRLQIISK